MPQTLLALGALLLAGFVALSQHRSSTHEQARAIRHEVEVDARSVGLEVLERLATLAFDAVVAPGDSTGLTPEAAFGLPLSSDPLADATDVDDVHAMNVEIERLYADPATGTPRALTFAVAADVGYVERVGGTVIRTGGVPTFAKEVVLEVAHPQLHRPYLFRRVYTP